MSIMTSLPTFCVCVCTISLRCVLCMCVCVLSVYVVNSISGFHLSKTSNCHGFICKVTGFFYQSWQRLSKLFFKSDQKKSKMFACWCWAGKDSTAVTSGIYLLTTLFLFRSKPCETPRPAISIQDPFSCAFPSLPGTGFVGIKQRKQSYGRAAVKKIWNTYSGGGSGSGGGTSGVSPTKK